MLSVNINGVRRTFVEGTSILNATRSLGIKLPALCHDPRLAPIGACRLCVVEVEGCPRPVTACNTLLADGMEIKTHTPELEKLRQTNLHLLATRHMDESVQARGEHLPASAAENIKEVSFGPAKPALLDESHPYIRVDMTRCIDCFRCVRICDDVQGQFVWRVWNRGADTRILPDSGTTLLESSCVSCGACADTCPTGAIEDKLVHSLGAPVHWTRTICPYCGVGCEMLAGTRGDQIVQVKPALDGPSNKGHLCVKGRYAFAFTRSRDRVIKPMLRSNGQWEAVSWPEAIRFAALNLQRIIQTYGPDSVAILGSARGTNEENYLAQKFARVVLGTNNVDCCARVCHAPTAMAMKTMLGTGAATNSFNDIEQAQGFLLCGTNATENHPVVGARIKQAVLRGAKLIVMDPRQIELARYAHVHLPIKLGTNVPLLNALACAIVEEELFDPAAVRDRISGWEDFQRFIKSFSPEAVADVCGIDPSLIRKAARLYATTKPAMCFHGLGMTEHTQGTEGVMCLVNLALLTGNFGKPGSGVNPLRGQNNVQGAAHMGCEPANLTGYVPLEQGRDLFEATWQTALPHTRGMNLMEMIDAAAAGKLKALWAIGYDVALTNPNAQATKAALKNLELVMVQDMFFNELAKECGHLLLPACSSFEKDGTFMNSERRVQRVRKVLEPRGDSKPDWEVICSVATEMGFGNSFNFRSPEEIWNEVRVLWKPGAGISYQRLDEQGGLQWPCPSEDHPGTDILHRQAFPHGQRAPLKCIIARSTAEKPSAPYPFLLTTGRTLYQFNAGTMTMRTRNAELRSTDTLDISPVDAAQLSLEEGDAIRIRSPYGEAVLPAHIEPAIKQGELFATFHTSQVFMNQVTGPGRDSMVATPAYKVTAVSIEKVPQPPSVATL